MPLYKAVLFDFDGTLTRPGALDLQSVRRMLNVPPGTIILEFIQALSPEARPEAMRRLEEIEIAGARNASPNAGAEDLVRLLAAEGVRRGIVTNNCPASVTQAMKAFPRISLADFDIVVHRENAPRPKPHPEGVQFAAGLLGVSPAEVLVIGDYVFDMEAGRRAGAPTAFLTNGTDPPAMTEPPTYVITSLLEVPQILGL